MKFLNNRAGTKFGILILATMFTGRAKDRHGVARAEFAFGFDTLFVVSAGATCAHMFSNYF